MSTSNEMSLIYIFLGYFFGISIIITIIYTIFKSIEIDMNIESGENTPVSVCSDLDYQV